MYVTQAHSLIQARKLSSITTVANQTAVSIATEEDDISVVLAAAVVAATAANVNIVTHLAIPL
jgi:hypothetical protein